MAVSRGEFEDVKQLLAIAARVSESNTQAIDRLANSQLLIHQDIQLVAQRMEAVQSDIREIQSDIRGLQTENRRILERIEQHFSDGHGAA